MDRSEKEGRKRKIKKTIWGGGVKKPRGGKPSTEEPRSWADLWTMQNEIITVEKTLSSHYPAVSIEDCGQEEEWEREAIWGLVWGKDCTRKAQCGPIKQICPE